jgi:hypothetical protein
MVGIAPMLDDRTCLLARLSHDCMSPGYARLPDDAQSTDDSSQRTDLEMRFARRTSTPGRRRHGPRERRSVADSLVIAMQDGAVPRRAPDPLYAAVAGTGARPSRSREARARVRHRRRQTLNARVHVRRARRPLRPLRQRAPGISQRRGHDTQHMDKCIFFNI